ncbi:MAG TPA: methylthioribulose 1-phosphate dehydratase [Vampirovibrionales bacterium]
MTLKKELSFFEERQIICDACNLFYSKGWVSGTGGGMTIKVNDTEALIAPSGVQKEQLKPEELFLVKLQHNSHWGIEIIEKPENKKISACTSIFTNIYKERPEAKAIIHSHSINAALLTKIVKNKKVTFSKYEMLKGLQGGTYFGEHTVPILNNVESECDLAEAVEQIVKEYPLSSAVLVRDHGVYIWGNSYQQAKVHAECYDYLFEAFIEEQKLKALNLA